MEPLLCFVDNDTTYLDRIRDHFARIADFRIETFDSAEAFWRALPSLTPSVAFLDVRMPGMSGIELAGLIREIRPEVHRVMLTNLDSEEAIFEALRNGADAYALKAELEDLASVAKVVMNGGSILTPTIAVRVVQSFRESAPNQSPEADKLTQRERQILDLMVQGLTLQKAASALGVSLNTARTHIKSIYRKLEVHDKSALFRKARDMGLL